MKMDKTRITQKEIDEIYEIIDKEPQKDESQSVLDKEEQDHDDRLEETLGWTEA